MTKKTYRTKSLFKVYSEHGSRQRGVAVEFMSFLSESWRQRERVLRMIWAF